MRKISIILCTLALSLSMTACSEQAVAETYTSAQETEQVEDTVQSEQETAETEEVSSTEQTEDSHVLIAYFSRWGNTEFPDDVDATTSASIVAGNDGELEGTTEYAARLIQKMTGGDLHLIQTEIPYPSDYDTVVDQNRQEQAEGTMPELSGTVENMEQYDTVFIGYPIWATTIPQPVAVFLEQYDFSGKTVIPFCTHAGYGSGNSYERIQELCPDAQVAGGLAIEAEEINDSETLIREWVSGLPISSVSQEEGTEGSAVTITVGETVITAQLNDSEAAQEFAAMLPVTVSMTRMGEHEYYGGLDTPLTHGDDLQTGYTVGDMAFWTPGDLFAVYFDEPEDDPEGLMILGHITSDMSVFDDMEGRVEMIIETAD